MVSDDCAKRGHRSCSIQTARNELSAPTVDFEAALDGNSYATTELDINADVDAILSVLSPALAETMRLRHLERLELSDIADRLHVPIGTVKRRIHDAKRHILRATMKTLDATAAWNIVSAVKTDVQKLPEDIRQDILALAVGGDLARDDFIPNNSGILVFPVISNRETLIMYDTAAYRAIADIFDRHCKAFADCAESPRVWENLCTDEIHLPTTAARFEPPTIPQPHWYSMYLFDLIDHHHMIYGDDIFADLYRPDPRQFTLRMASAMQQAIRSNKISPVPPVGFGTVVHWQVIKTVRLLQLHISGLPPTLLHERVIRNYEDNVPQFPTKIFGADTFRKDMKARYPVDRKEFSETHVAKCREFIDEACALLLREQSIIDTNDDSPYV